MTDAAIANATAKRDALAADINRLQDELVSARGELDRVERFIADWHKFAGVAEQYKNESVMPANSGVAPDAAKKRPQNPSLYVVGGRIAEILGASDKPLSRQELFDQLEKLGVHLQGRNPIVVLSTMLWRMKDRFPHLRGHGYWQVERDYKPAGYVANSGRHMLASDTDDGPNRDAD